MVASTTPRPPPDPGGELASAGVPRLYLPLAVTRFLTVADIKGNVGATRGFGVYPHFILDTGNNRVYTCLCGQRPLVDLQGRDLYNGSA